MNKYLIFWYDGNNYHQNTIDAESWDDAKRILGETFFGTFEDITLNTGVEFVDSGKGGPYSWEPLNVFTINDEVIPFEKVETIT